MSTLRLEITDGDGQTMQVDELSLDEGVAKILQDAGHNGGNVPLLDVTAYLVSEEELGTITIKR